MTWIFTDRLLMTEQMEEALFCANHPNRETALRCNRCEKLICPECAVSTPTGYRCKECVRGQQKVFDTTEWYDYPAAVVIGAVLSYLGSLLAARLGFWSLFLAPGAGVLIAEIVRAVLRRRRGLRLYRISTAAVVIGSLPLLLQYLLFGLLGTFSGGGAFSLFGVIWQAYYTIAVTTSFYTRLSGIQLRR